MKQSAEKSETAIHIEGMMCSMCESHLETTLRKAFPKASVHCSRKTGICLLKTETNPDPAAIHGAIDPTGYQIVKIEAGKPAKKSFWKRLARHS